MLSTVLSALYAVIHLILTITIAVTVPISQMRKQQFSKVKSLSLDSHQAGNYYSLKLNLGYLILEVCTFNRRLTK